DLQTVADPMIDLFDQVFLLRQRIPRSAPEFEMADDQLRDVSECVKLLLRRPTWPRIEDAQPANGCSVAKPQRHSGIEADPGQPADERMTFCGAVPTDIMQHAHSVVLKYLAQIGTTRHIRQVNVLLRREPDALAVDDICHGNRRSKHTRGKP